MWKDKSGNYLIDISKYVFTGVIIASIFKDLDDKFTLYCRLYFFFHHAFLRFVVGLLFSQKRLIYGSLHLFHRIWCAGHNSNHSDFDTSFASMASEKRISLTLPAAADKPHGQHSGYAGQNNVHSHTNFPTAIATP